MKKPALLLSHLCLFSLGAGVAYLATSNDPAGTTSSEASRNETNARAARTASPDRSLQAPRTSGAERDSAIAKRASTGEDIQKLTNITDRFERERALMNYFERLSPEQFATTAEELQNTYHLGGENSAMRLLFNAWAKADPLAALDHIEANPKLTNNRGTVLETWAAGDPSSAENWAKDHHSGDGPNPHMPSVIAGIAATDLNYASRLTQEMPRSNERGSAIDAVSRALLASGVENALAFPDSITDEHLKGSFINTIAGHLGQKDPEAAASWVASLDNGGLQNRAAEGVARLLASASPELARDFVVSLLPEARARAAVPTVRAISRNDIPGAAEWINTLAGTPGYDRIVEEYVWSTNSRAPEQSAAWIRAIDDERRQTQIYHRMLGEWARSDAAAVRTWVAENEVPADVQRRFSR